MVAVVILDIQTRHLNKLFDYFIPSEYIKKARIGMRVVVPVNNKQRLGYIVEIKEYSKYATKEISYFLDTKPTITNNQFKIIDYILNRSFASFNEVFKAVIPDSLYFKYELEFDVIDEEKLPDNFKEKVTRNKISLLKVTDDKLKEFNKILNQKVIRSVIDKPFKKSRQTFTLNEDRVTLTEEQNKIVEAIILNETKTHLVVGPPASGKTEVILKVIEKSLNENQQTVVLTPEVSLIPQLASRIKERFSKEVILFHSRLSRRERYESYLKIKEDPSAIIVGTRSTLFLPFKKLGAIILDEAHDLSYIQKQTPYYDAKEIAELISVNQKIPLVFLTATPSIKQYYDASLDKVKLHHLTDLMTPPNTKVKFIDMKDELMQGNTSILSKHLKLEIEKRIALDEQVILLVNRKGYAPFVLCRVCGHVKKCPNCLVSLVYHKGTNTLKCHHCNYSEPYTNKCPRCKSDKLRPVGFGIEQVEEALTKEIQGAKVIRMDAETTSKDNTDKILTSFLNKEANILIGTQMVSKGHHFENVSLVGVLLADQMLQMNSYLAHEQTYNLLIQHIGRIRKDGGLALIQGYDQQHFVIQSILSKDFNLFYNKELEIRKLLHIEPFYNVIKITMKGISAHQTYELLNRIKNNILKRNTQIKIIGPTENYIFHFEGRFHYSITLKVPKTTKIEYLLKNIDRKYDQNFLVDIDYYPDQI